MSIADAEEIANRVRDHQLEQMANGEIPAPMVNPAEAGETVASHVITFRWPDGSVHELVMGNINGMVAMEVYASTNKLFGERIALVDLVKDAAGGVGFEAMCVLIFAARRQAGETVTLEDVLTSTTISTLPEVEVEDGTEEDPAVPLDRPPAGTVPRSGG